MTAAFCVVVLIALFGCLAGWVAIGWPELSHDDGKEGEPYRGDDWP